MFIILHSSETSHLGAQHNFRSDPAIYYFGAFYLTQMEAFSPLLKKKQHRFVVPAVTLIHTHTWTHTHKSKNLYIEK